MDSLVAILPLDTALVLLLRLLLLTLALELLVILRLQLFVRMPMLWFLTVVLAAVAVGFAVILQPRLRVSTAALMVLARLRLLQAVAV